MGKLTGLGHLSIAVHTKERGREERCVKLYVNVCGPEGNWRNYGPSHVT